MTISIRGNPALEFDWSVANATTLTPNMPTGGGVPQAGDLILVVFGLKPFSAAPTISAGYTALGTFFADGSVGAGNGTGSVRIGGWWREATGGESAPTITWGTTSVPGLATIFAFQKTGASWVTPTWNTGSDTDGGTAYSATMNADPGVAAGDMCYAFTCLRDDTTQPGLQTFTQTGVTYDTGVQAPAGFAFTTVSNDLSAVGTYREALSGTSSAAPVVTATFGTGETGATGFIRLRETAGGGGASEVPRPRPQMRQLLAQ